MAVLPPWYFGAHRGRHVSRFVFQKLLQDQGHTSPRSRGEVFALIAGNGRLRESELGEMRPHPDPLHSPSKTGVNALMASGEREKKHSLAYRQFNANTNT